MRLEVAIRNWEKSRKYLNKLTNDIPEDKWFIIPENNFSNLLWQYAHIIASDYRLILQRVRGEKPEDSNFIPSDFISLFAKGSKPEEHSNYTIKQLNELNEKLLETIKSESNGWTEEFLLTEAIGNPHPQFKIKIEAIEYSVLHNFLHCGQIGVLRRQLGFESLG